MQSEDKSSAINCAIVPFYVAFVFPLIALAYDIRFTNNLPSFVTTLISLAPKPPKDQLMQF